MPLQRLEENLHQERVWLKSTPKPKKKNLKKRIWWERNLKIKKRALYFGFCHPWVRHPHFILTRFGNSIWFNCRHQGAFPCMIASKPSMAPISTRIYFDPKKKGTRIDVKCVTSVISASNFEFLYKLLYDFHTDCISTGIWLLSGTIQNTDNLLKSPNHLLYSVQSSNQRK